MPYPRTCFSRPYPTRRSARWIGIIAGLALTAAVLDTLPAKAAPPAEAEAVPAANVTTQTVGANFDTFVQNTFTTDQSTTTELKIGTYDGGTNKARSYLRFDNQEWLWDKQIQSATLNLWEHHSFSCTAKEWQAWRTPDVTNAVRWSNQPGYKRAYVGFHKWGYKQHRNVARWSWKWTKRGWRKLFG